MIRFKLDEIAHQMPTLVAQLNRRKRVSPPGKWRPWLKLTYEALQDEDTEQWVSWVKWELFDSKGAFPCRETGKHESISRTDPPDFWPTEKIASLFAGECIVAMREQYNKWIQQDFSTKGIDP